MSAMVQARAFPLNGHDMKKTILLALSLSLPLQALAAPKPRALAQESLDFVNRMEAMLQGSIRSGDRADLYRFVEKPTIDMMNKWPATGTAGYIDFARCQFALQDFRTYAQDQFAAGGRLPKSSPSYKDLLNSKRQCAAALK